MGIILLFVPTQKHKIQDLLLCSFVPLCGLVQHLFDQSIDVDLRCVEEANAVVFLGAQQ